MTTYTLTQKAEVVALTLKNVEIAEITAKTGASKSSINRWTKVEKIVEMAKEMVANESRKASKLDLAKEMMANILESKHTVSRKDIIAQMEALGFTAKGANTYLYNAKLLKPAYTALKEAGLITK